MASIYEYFNRTYQRKKHLFIYFALFLFSFFSSYKLMATPTEDVFSFVSFGFGIIISLTLIISLYLVSNPIDKNK